MIDLCADSLNTPCMVCKSVKRQNNLVINILLIYFIDVIDKAKTQLYSRV